MSRLAELVPGPDGLAPFTIRCAVCRATLGVLEGTQGGHRITPADPYAVLEVVGGERIIQPPRRAGGRQPRHRGGPVDLVERIDRQYLDTIWLRCGRGHRSCVTV
jgi:hypothetical protein